MAQPLDGSARTDIKTDILFVIGSLELGGAEKHLATIASALRVRGWPVAIFSLAGAGPALEICRAGGVEVICPPLERTGDRQSRVLRGLRMTIAVAHLFWTMMIRRPGIVHFFLPASYLVGAPLAILAGIKLRVMSRRSLNVYQNYSRLVRPAERWLHRLTTAIIGNSRRVMAELETEGTHPRQLGLIYNGVANAGLNDSNNHQAARLALGVSDSTLVFVIVANLIPYKGHLDLVEALRLSASQIPGDWRVLIIGRDDGAGTEIKARAATCGIADHLLFLGPRSDVPALLAASDIGLLASHQEGFSNAVLEGMSFGLPMIVTDVGGNAEAVIDGETGLVVPPHDACAFGDAIVRLARDPELRKIYGAAGRRRVESNFTLEGCAAKYEALYHGLIAGKSPRDISDIRYSD